MKVRLYRHSGLPPSPENYDAFIKEYKEGFNEIWPEGDDDTKKFLALPEEEQRDVARRTFELEQKLFRKYPREEILNLESHINLRFYVKKYGSLCFVFEKIEGKEKLTAYVMDGPVQEDQGQKIMEEIANVQVLRPEQESPPQA